MGEGPATALSLLAGCAGALPGPLRRAAGRTIGLTSSLLSTRMACTTATNLALVQDGLGRPAGSELVRASLVEDGILAMEVARTWTAPPRTLLEAIDEGADLQRFERARASGRGLLLLVPHLGNWELLNLWLQSRVDPARPFTALYDPARNPGVDGWMLRARGRTGARLLPVSTAGIRDLLRTLSAGGIGALLPDQVPPRGSGVHAPFFGRPALTMTLLQRLVRRAEPELLAATALRHGGRWRLHFESVDPGVRDGDPIGAATALNRTLEACVKLAPEQYQWGYKRFKRPPEGLPDPYRRRSMQAK